MGRNSYILCKHGAAATLERIITLLLRKTICKCIQIVDLFTSRNNVIHIYIVCIVFLLCILVQFSMILQQSSLFGGEQPLFLGVPWFSSHCPGKKNMVFLQLSPAFPPFFWRLYRWRWIQKHPRGAGSAGYLWEKSGALAAFLAIFRQPRSFVALICFDYP